MVHISLSFKDTGELAGKFLGTLPKEEQAVVVCFYGDLGAGKTSFIQLLAKRMGINETITSPTFVIQKKYKAEKYFDTLVHIDAYRLSSGSEIEKLNFKETLAMPNSLICIEWPENIQTALPEVVREVKCKFIDETTHSYEF